MTENNENASLSAPSAPPNPPPVEKCEIWSVGSYTSFYFGVKVHQPTESRIGVNLTSLERANALMEILDQEERSNGYVCKKEGYRGEVLSQSPKARIARASISEVKNYVNTLLTAKVEAINAMQNVFPVDCTCGGAQVFIERAPINFERMVTKGNFNAQEHLTCFFLDPASPGNKRAISLRYYRTHGGKCQYQYFTNDLRSIFGQEIAERIADPRKVLKAAVAKYSQVIAETEAVLAFSPQELEALNTRFNQTQV